MVIVTSLIVEILRRHFIYIPET